MSKRVVYKLTDQNMRTYGGCQWKIGKEKKTSGKGELCTKGWLHCYSSPLLAMLLNPIHAGFENPRLFKALVKGRGKKDLGLKYGYSSMTLIEEIPLPIITETQQRAFAILCAKKVCFRKGWNEWADNWLSGADRSEESRRKASAAAHAAYASAAADAASTASAATYAYAAAAAYAAAKSVASLNLEQIAQEAMLIKE